MPGYPPKKVYANTYDSIKRAKNDEERQGKKKESKKFEKVGKLKLTEAQKAFTLKELKKIKRNKLSNKTKKN